MPATKNTGAILLPQNKKLIFVFMAKTKSFFKHLKHLAGLGLILFSLAPCSVKNTVAQTISVAYQTPLNKTKTTSFNSSCGFSFGIAQQHTAVHKVLISESIAFPQDNEFTIQGCTRLTAQFPKRHAGNSPPPYILYKCLKIAMA